MTASQQPVSHQPPPEILAHHEVAYPGLNVVWYEAADKRRIPCPAIIFRVNWDSVDLCVFYMNEDEGGLGWRNKRAVRHVDDPRIPHKPNWRNEGGWDFGEEFRRSQIVADLALRVEELESKVKGDPPQPRRRGRPPKHKPAASDIPPVVEEPQQTM